MLEAVAPLRHLSLLLGAALALCACVHVPTVDETALLAESEGQQKINVYGVHGPLSNRQSRLVLSRVAAQAPDASVLMRHLAVEQIVSESPLYTGNSVRLLRDGAQTFPAMFDAIAGAKHFVYLEYYIFEDVQCEGRHLGDLLEERSRAGVHVDVIYDAVGSLDTPPEFFARLRAAGVRLVEYNPVNPLKAAGHYSINSRDHRKILVADGEVAITGGVNLSSTYESAPTHDDEGAERAKQAARGDHPVWHDLDLEVRGPVVAEFARLFREHWKEQKGPPLEEAADPRPDPPAGREIVRVIGSSPAKLASRYYATALTAIRTAESSVWLTAAYFVPTRQELSALKAAARRGVDVRVLLPSHSDVNAVLAVQRSYYPELLRAGIKVYERGDGIVHSKSMVIDDVWSLVGSSNFDQRSVLFNDEVDAVVLGKHTADQIRQNLESDMARARRIDWQSVRQRGLGERLKAWFWRLWRPML
jgi:cardiolipin synthase A/B